MTTDEFVRRLLALGETRGEIPLFGSREWEALEPTDPRTFAAVVRAAEAWRRESTDEAIAARLRAELEDIDLFIRYRSAEASRDVAELFNATERYGEPFSEVRRRRDELLGVA